METIFQVDGPEIAILESVDISGGDRLTEDEKIHDLEFKEVSFREKSYVNAARRLANKYYELIECAKERIGYSDEYNKYHKYSCLTLVWRVRPYIEHVKNKHGTIIGYCARFRVATIPDLTEEQWEDFLGVPTGEIPDDCKYIDKKED